MYAVILAGGGGTRLWPLSRAGRPKPFLPLSGDASLIQVTVARLLPLVSAQDIFIVADQRYRDLIVEQLPLLAPNNVVSEPMGRNTAAAVALAALAIKRRDDDVMAVLPADHRIADEEAFRSALEAAAQVARDGSLVTLGIKPKAPETGYGYIISGPPLAGAARIAGFHVERFVEKPSIERATEMVGEGRALWNAGIFVWRRRDVLDGLGRHAPEILEPIRSALVEGGLAAAYPSIRSTSIDHALAEPASLEGRMAVLPVDIGWSDVGSWAALLEALVERNGVVAQAEAGSETLDIDSRDVLVHAAGGRLVVTVGLEGTIVVDTPDAVLVCAADKAQDVKLVVDRLIAAGRTDRL